MNKNYNSESHLQPLKIIISLLILIITVFLFTYAHKKIVDIEEERCWQVLSDSAEMVRNDISLTLQRDIAFLRMTAEHLAIDDNLHTHNSSALYPDSIRENTMFIRIDTVFPDGNVMTTSEHDVSAWAERYSELAAQGECVSDRTVDFITSSYVVYYYSPVVKDGVTSAVLIGVIDCGNLSNYITTPAYNGKAMCFLVDRSDGSFITDPVSETLGNVIDMTEHPRLKGYEEIVLSTEMMGGNTGTVAYTSNGRDFYGYYTDTGELDWHMLVVVPGDEVFAGRMQLDRTMTVITLIECAVMAGYLLWTLYSLRQISRSKADAEYQLLKSNVLIQCVTELSSGSPINDAINHLLEIVTHYFSGDRTYLFDIDYAKSTTSNTYEYAADGVTKEIDILQNVPLYTIEPWLQKFRESGIFYLSDVQSDVDRESDTYKILAAQSIHSLIAVPLMFNGEIAGFMGVDNPQRNYRDLSLLSSVQYFIMEALERSRTSETLTNMSYNDTLTGLFNRNKYNQICDYYTENPPCNVGTAFFDLDGLKKTNDQFGHEAGDRLIKNAAYSIRQHFPGFSFRVGGDEFVVIIPDISEEEFLQRIADIRRSLTAEDISIAIGTSWSESCTDLAGQLKEADSLMYVEKQAHRSQQS